MLANLVQCLRHQVPGGKLLLFMLLYVPGCCTVVLLVATCTVHPLLSFACGVWQQSDSYLQRQKCSHNAREHGLDLLAKVFAGVLDQLACVVRLLIALVWNVLAVSFRHKTRCGADMFHPAWSLIRYCAPLK
jgi:hypothetical protein